MKTLLIILLIFLMGCTSTTLEYEGIVFEQTSFGGREVKTLQITTPSGYSIYLEGYEREPVEPILAAVIALFIAGV